MARVQRRPPNRPTVRLVGSATKCVCGPTMWLAKDTLQMSQIMNVGRGRNNACQSVLGAWTSRRDGCGGGSGGNLTCIPPHPQRTRLPWKDVAHGCSTFSRAVASGVQTGVVQGPWLAHRHGARLHCRSDDSRKPSGGRGAQKMLGARWDHDRTRRTCRGCMSRVHGWTTGPGSSTGPWGEGGGHGMKEALT